MGDLVRALSKITGKPLPGEMRPRKEMKKKAMKDSLNWIRRNDAKVDENPDNDLVNALSKITGKPLPDDMTSRAKKDFVDESMNWLREFNPGNLDTVDDA